MLELLRRPSALLPLVISATLLALIIAHVVRFGLFYHQADEDTAAHLFQILMPTQALIIVFFAASWLPRSRGLALQVLALQCSAAFAVLAAVHFLRL